MAVAGGALCAIATGGHRGKCNPLYKAAPTLRHVIKIILAVGSTWPDCHYVLYRLAAACPASPLIKSLQMATLHKVL
ncbi:hypothetical protein E2562_028805 [Oryza meyeriana var. granulata]|uniref:Uncharacterized protein n=1 Tax=Oryza meyeriana var. granulata TaxID=110450 RepID=A0A6G1EE40_9ORYZ|nr:hypothetical protein E2562_028805 [Oryza meyeriana var. granulata]